ncbi:unnamed protein product, partial [marine sediment metagenome]
DGVTPFTRLGGGVIQRGVGAPNSFIRAGNNILFLDTENRLVVLNNKTPVVVSKPFNKYIAGFESIKDAVADDITIGGRTFYVLSFKKEDKTLVYDYENKGWTEWGEWDASLGDHRRFKGNSYTYASAWRKHLVGDKSNGKIYELDSEIYQDDGEPIRFFRRSQHINHGTDQRKRSREILIKVKTVVSDGVPDLIVRWRDNGGTTWSNDHIINLNKVGAGEFIARMHQLGMYRTRQYEISFTENHP